MLNEVNGLITVLMTREAWLVVVELVMCKQLAGLALAESDIVVITWWFTLQCAYL